MELKQVEMKCSAVDCLLHLSIHNGQGQLFKVMT